MKADTVNRFSITKGCESFSEVLIRIRCAVIGVIAVLLIIHTETLYAKTYTARSRHIVSQHKAVFDSPPKHVPSFQIVDGPITGNGDIGLTLSGPPEKQRYWISKNDFWKSGPHFKQCGPSLIGGIDIHIEQLEGASYHVQQILYSAVIASEFSTETTTLHMNAWVPAMDNLVVLELSTSRETVDVQVDLWAKEEYGSETDKRREKNFVWVSRAFRTGNLMYPSEATIALRHVPSTGSSFQLTPDEPVTIVAAVVTNHESQRHNDLAREKVKQLTLATINRRKSEHNEWWQDFWAQSLVELEDKLIEKHYYASLYIMACCSRNEHFAPGLYGNWITMDRLAWAGDIHLNYNCEAPYWALYSSNRVSLTDPYDAPLLEHINVFKQNARLYLDKKGAYAGVGIGPKCLSSRFFDHPMMNKVYGEKFGSTAYEDLAGQPMFLGQKSNAVFASLNMILRYRYTYDMDYARKVYPYLIEVAEFWEDYLSFEGGRYVIYNDSFHEVGPWQGKGWEEGYGDFNPINSIGYLRTFFDAMIDISEELDLDVARRGKWKHILKNLSDFPVVMLDGRKRFRACEGGDGSAKDIVGLNWNMLHGLVFPATNIGLSSDLELLKMIREDMKEWDDKIWLNHGNAFQTVFIGAARVGYDPNFLWSKARDKVARYSYTNLWITAGGGGIETCSGIPGMVNEMMLQSHGDIIRIFPAFPDNQNASFHRLRTFGAFLVSSVIDNGEIQYVVVESEKGRECNIFNPWPDRAVSIRRNGKDEVVSGTMLRLLTTLGEKITLVPQERQEVKQ